MLQPQIFKLSSYNCWANELCTGYVLAAGEEKADRIQTSSFPTIRKTLYHIWDAELAWITRLNHQTLPGWPPSAGFNGTLQEGSVALLATSKKLMEYVMNATENSLQESISYSSSNNSRFTSKVCDMLTHCLNHSTYHRGQLITMLRVAGFTTVGSTDFITYCRLHSTD